MKIIFAVALLVFVSTSLVLAEDTTRPTRILFFTKSQRHEHSVIKRTDDKPSFAETVLAGLAWKNNWVITTGKVDADITPNIETVTPHYADLPPMK